MTVAWWFPMTELNAEDLTRISGGAPPPGGLARGTAEWCTGVTKLIADSEEDRQKALAGIDLAPTGAAKLQAAQDAESARNTRDNYMIALRDWCK